MYFVDYPSNTGKEFLLKKVDLLTEAETKISVPDFGLGIAIWDNMIYYNRFDEEKPGFILSLYKTDVYGNNNELFYSGHTYNIQANENSLFFMNRDDGYSGEWRLNQLDMSTNEKTILANSVSSYVIVYDVCYYSLNDTIYKINLLTKEQESIKLEKIIANFLYCRRLDVLFSKK